MKVVTFNKFNPSMHISHFWAQVLDILYKSLEDKSINMKKTIT